MNSPPSRPARRGMLVAAAFAVALLLSYLSIRNALANHESELQTLQGYERATRLEPGDFRNWYLLGRYWQYNLENPDPSRAILAYGTALQLNPHDATIWSDLATSYEAEGDVAAARDSFVHAKRAYPLSAEISWRYANFLLRQGELDTAFAEMRKSVQADPLRGAEALSRSLRAQPDIDQVIDRVLPPSTASYLDVIVDQTAEGHTDNALKVWGRLVMLQPHLNLRDSFPLVDALRREKRIPEAHRVWDQAVALAGLASLPGPANSAIWDGGFESGAIGGGYTWNPPVGIPNVEVSFDAHERHSGNRSLRLFFNGKTNVNLVGPCHEVPVEPSTDYQFSAWVRTQAITTDQGIRFQLRSSDNPPGLPAAVTADVHGTQPWVLLETLWSARPNVHEMEVCVARTPSREADDKIQGIAWVDDVALVPQAPGPSKP